MMTTEEHAREMARVYIPHEGGFTMGGLLQTIIEYFETEIASKTMDAEVLRAERNVAQQRAEQAERERDEAREYLRRITAIVDAWARVPTSMPHALKAIGKVLNERDAMTPAEPQPAPTVKAKEPAKYTMTLIAHLIDRATDRWNEAGDNEKSIEHRVKYLQFAVGDILDILERLVKGGAK